MRMVIRSWWVELNGIPKARCRRFTIRLMVLFQRSVMFISLPKAARPSARWMLGRGSSERRRLGLPRSCRTNLRTESRSRKSEQRDKWSFCLTASKISPRIRRDDEQETTPESHTKLQGQGGACRHQGRDDAFTACGAF